MCLIVAANITNLPHITTHPGCQESYTDCLLKQQSSGPETLVSMAQRPARIPDVSYQLSGYFCGEWPPSTTGVSTTDIRVDLWLVLLISWTGVSGTSLIHVTRDKLGHWTPVSHTCSPLSQSNVGVMTWQWWHDIDTVTGKNFRAVKEFVHPSCFKTSYRSTMARVWTTWRR